MLFLITGLTLTISRGYPANTAGGPLLTGIMGEWSYSEILWALAIVAVMHVVLRHTRWGLHTVAIGGNIVAAAEAGIAINRIKIGNFILTSTLGGFTGLLEAFRVGSIDPLAGGSNMMFLGVASGVIGGTAIAGGAGAIVGGVVGRIMAGGVEDGVKPQVFVERKPVQLASVDDARALGIECVYQDLALVNGLSIYHNMFLNRELLRRGPLRLLDHREMRRRAAEALAEIGVDVPSVELEVGALSGGQRQAIAVARAVYSKARILLLDEPLAAMGAREARLIIGLIERLRARGDIAIVMIAHNYAQTLAICDRLALMQHPELTSPTHPPPTPP